MTHADIALPTAVRSLVDLLLQSVGAGLRALMHRYGAPGEARSNAGAFVDLSFGFTVVRRLAKILRYALLILALRVVPAEAPPTTRGTSTQRDPRGPRRPAFAVTSRWPSILEPRHAQPPQLARGVIDRRETLARRMEALSHALRNTMPLIRRLAHSLARGVVLVLRWRPPKRTPRRRDYWEELLSARDQADFDLENWRRSDSN